MQGIILVGGQGQRLRPLTSSVPKPLLPIVNIAFVERQIKWLAKNSIDEVVLSLGYLPNAFEDYFKAHPIQGVKISYAVESEPLGTAGAIKYAAGDLTGDFVVCNGDVLTDLNLTELVEFHKNNSSMATIALTYVEDPSAFGVVPTKENGEVVAFVEKPPRESAPSHWINAGIYVLSSDFLDLIPDGMNVSIERETFPNLLREGKMYAIESEAYWLDIGTPTQYLKAHKDFIEQIDRFGSNDDLKEIYSGIYSSGQAKIGDNVRVESPAIVGDGSEIMDNVELQASCIGNHCYIGKGSKITNSVILSGARIGDNCTIDSSIVGGDSIVGDNCEIYGETLIGFGEKIEANSLLQSDRIPSVV